MTRDTRITLWPEQTDFFPMSNSWREIKNKSVLDFSFCRQINSCGLAASALMLMWIFNFEKFQNSLQDTKQSEQLSLIKDYKKLNNFCADKINTIYKNNNSDLNNMIKQLGFLDAIKDFISNDVVCLESSNHMINSMIDNKDEKSYPLFVLKNLSRDFRQIEYNRFMDFIIPIFDNFFSNHNKSSQFAHILEEIYKNIVDHSKADGIIGISTIRTESKNRISVLIGDAGPGVYQHILNNLKGANSNRKEKLDFSHAYKLALKNGFSTKIGEKNYGCGMSTIINHCLAIGAHLSVFDAESRIVLSALSPILDDAPSHNEIWRASCRFVKNRPFFYFIQCED